MGALNVTVIGGDRRQEAKLPDDKASGTLVTRLVTAMGLPTSQPDGAPISYQLIDASTGRQISESETLAGANVREGGELRLAPVAAASDTESASAPLGQPGAPVIPPVPPLARPGGPVIPPVPPLARPGGPVIPPVPPLAQPGGPGQGPGSSPRSVTDRFRSWSPQARYGTVAATVLVLYLILAGAGSLPPFSKSSTTTTSTTTTTTQGSNLTTAQQQLAALIPSSVYGSAPPGQSGSSCTVSTTPVSGYSPGAEFSCDLSSSLIPGGAAATYVTFSSDDELSTAYQSFLSNNSLAEDAGDCENFTNFTSCETVWTNSSCSTGCGRIVEVTSSDNGSPVATLAWTMDSNDLWVIASSNGNDGDSLLQWWDDNDWLASS